MTSQWDSTKVEFSQETPIFFMPVSFRDNDMIRGILLVTGACALWGLIFIIPLFLENYGVVDIALGRYFFFGLVSLGCLGCRGIFFFRFPLAIWMETVKLAFFSTILHYCALMVCMRYLGSAVTTLILGLSAICIALYGGYKERAPLLNILFPCGLIFCGLPLSYLAKIEAVHSTPIESLLGIIFALIALGSWVMYLLANNACVKKYSHIKAHDWISLIGVAALIFVLALQTARAYFTSTYSLSIDLKFCAGTFILGAGSSWLASFLWNKGSELIPLYISGPLVILETVFGLLFVYLFKREFPKTIEWAGIILMLLGIFLCLRTSAQNLRKIQKNEIDRLSSGPIPH